MAPLRHRRRYSLPFILLFFLIFSSLPAGCPDQNSERAALLAFRSAVGTTVLSWNVSQPLCTWKGVNCTNSVVTDLRFPGRSLMGTIPIGILGNFSSLRTLSLRVNSLSGPLPADLASCSHLQYLYLNGNRFSGQFPAVILSLPELVQLNLAYNNFSGEIPVGLNNLTQLGTLYLEENQFTGAIPDLVLPNLSQFNVSFNQLNGSIPLKLQSWTDASFMGMLSLCGRPLAPCPSPPPGVSPTPSVSPGGGKKNKLSGGAIAGIAIACVVGFLLLVLLLVFCCRRCSTSSAVTGTAKTPESEMAGKGAGESGNVNANPRSQATRAVASGQKGGDAASNKKLVFFGGKWEKVFDLEDLLRASAEVLGKGTFGTAYKAVLEMGTTVAVKRLKEVDVPELEFRKRIDAVGAMDHPNLVPLRAYYYSKDEKLLVYDYMPMGSLSALLHGNGGSGRTPLDWDTRLSIAFGTARGIEYIHSTGAGASHGNIKPSNVLLAKSYEAHVSDHGLAQLARASSMPNRVTGYRAPEVTDPHNVSQKADVYSFGVLLLELLTGKAPAQALVNDDGIDLPRWVQSIVRDEWTSEVFDMELLRYQTVEEEMVQLLQLAIDCAAEYPDNRPTMSKVVVRIDEIKNSSQDPPSEVETQKQKDTAIGGVPGSGSGSPAPTSLLD